MITLLPGDGIGPEVTAAGQQVLEKVATRFGHHFEFDSQLIGGAAIDAVGAPLPDDTAVSCERADAVLLGAVGGPNGRIPMRLSGQNKVCWRCVPCSVSMRIFDLSKSCQNLPRRHH